MHAERGRAYRVPLDSLPQHRLVDPDGKPIQIRGRPFVELVDLDDGEARVVSADESGIGDAQDGDGAAASATPAAGPSDNSKEGAAQGKERKASDGPTYDFLLLDTPGLDDSSGEDLAIMAEILGRVVEVGHINAVVYVRHVSHPFGASFGRFFSYLQRCMPSLAAGLMVVHSGFSTDRVEEFAEDGDDLAQVRRSAFEEAVRDTAAAASLQMPQQHFFLDGAPDGARPFAVWRALGEARRLLQTCAARRPLPVAASSAAGGLRLLKTARMRDLDAHVLAAVDGLCIRLERGWAAAKRRAGEAAAARADAARQLGAAGRAAGDRRARLEALRSGADVVLGTRSADEHYSWVGDLLLRGVVGVGGRQVEFDAPDGCPISAVAKTAGDGCRWEDETLQGPSWRATLMAGMFRDLSGSATFYARSRDKNAREIELLEGVLAESAPREEFLARLAGGLTDGNDGDGDQAGESELAALGRQLQAASSVRAVIAGDGFDAALWPRVRAFYATWGTPDKGAVTEYVRVYSETVAKLL